MKSLIIFLICLGFVILFSFFLLYKIVDLYEKGFK